MAMLMEKKFRTTEDGMDEALLTDLFFLSPPYKLSDDMRERIKKEYLKMVASHANDPVEDE